MANSKCKKIEETLENFVFAFPLNFDYLLNDNNNNNNNNAFIWLMLWLFMVEAHLAAHLLQQVKGTPLK